MTDAMMLVQQIQWIFKQRQSQIYMSFLPWESFRI